MMFFDSGCFLFLCKGKLGSGLITCQRDPSILGMLLRISLEQGSFLMISLLKQEMTLLEIRSFTTTILGFSRPQIGGRGIPRRKKVCFSRPHVCGRDR